MPKVRGNLGQRLQDEEAFVQTRMRHSQLRPATDKIIVEQQVEVDGARPVVSIADAARLLLDFQERSQKLLRLELRLQLGGRVEKIALPRRPTDRLGFVIGRNLVNHDSGFLTERLESAVKVFAPVSEIAAQGDVCDATHTRSAPRAVLRLDSFPRAVFYF